MMHEQNLVSIVTPAWKAAAFIAEAVQSVQQQTYPHWEMLVVDDASPDDTASRVEVMAREDPRIRLLTHAQNAGPAAARNTALAAAKGRWIAMLDSDDQWPATKLARQLAFHQEKKTKLSYTSYRRTTADGSQSGGSVMVPESLTYRQLLGNTAIATSTVLIDRNLAGTPSFKSIYYDDFGCWLDLLRDGSKAYGLQEDLMRYRVVSHSVSRNKFHSAQQVWKTYREVESLSRARASYYFLRYATHALRKYKSF